ncbi:MAG: hypothetical protein ACFFDP_08910 [Promethearchaeota archaeon]
MKTLSKTQTMTVTLLVALVSTLFLPAVNVAVAGAPSNPDLQGFDEMLPGVFVSWKWWNQTSDDWENPTDATGQVSLNYTVTDTSNNTYVITEEGEYHWQRYWTYICLLVRILQDPDRSYVRWLASHQHIDEGLLESPQRTALTGDEVFIHSPLYYFNHQLSYSYNFTYSWHKDGMINVDPNTVIPNLSSKYSWAKHMNGTQTGEGTQEYSKIGFGVTEIFLIRNATTPAGLPIHQLVFMQHNFAGLTAFNDTDGDGLIDLFTQNDALSYTDAIDLGFHLLNSTETELVYNLDMGNATISDVSFPHLNADREIEWSMEFSDINGELIPFDRLFGSPQLLLMYIPWQGNEGIPTMVENLKFTCRFSLTDEGAVLKVDQHIGNFWIPGTQTILPEADGLSLALSYWSGVTRRVRILGNGSTPVDTENLTSAEELVSGRMDLLENEIRLGAIDFGGTYVWGKDGGTYDVGTVITPIYRFHCLHSFISVPQVVGYFRPMNWATFQYFYSSCYSNWDGYAITHDPVYTAYPAIPPGEALLNGLWALIPAVALTIVALIATAIVIVRIRGVRKTAKGRIRITN